MLKFLSKSRNASIDDYPESFFKFIFVAFISKTMEIKIIESNDISKSELIGFIKSIDHSFAVNPEELYHKLVNSLSLVTAWDDDEIVGLGNVIADENMIVRYPHLIVSPDYEDFGIEESIMKRLKQKIATFIQNTLPTETQKENHTKTVCEFK